jgi:hypothetical protein
MRWASGVRSHNSVASQTFWPQTFPWTALIANFSVNVHPANSHIYVHSFGYVDDYLRALTRPPGLRPSYSHVTPSHTAIRTAKTCPQQCFSLNIAEVFGCQCALRRHAAPSVHREGPAEFPSCHQRPAPADRHPRTAQHTTYSMHCHPRAASTMAKTVAVRKPWGHQLLCTVRR